MRNNWVDVIIINLCLIAYAHWLSDLNKDIFKSEKENEKKESQKFMAWTVIPELIGTGASLAGLYFQHSDDGAYFRVMDYDYAPSSTVWLSWVAVMNVTAHLSTIGIIYDKEKEKDKKKEKEEIKDKEFLGKAKALRKMSYGEFFSDHLLMTKNI